VADMGNFIRRLLKLDSPITVGQWCWDRVSGNWATLAALAGGAGMSYLAAISTWLKPYAPISWAFTGLTGCLFLAAVFYLICKGRCLWTHTTITKAFHEQNAHTINPFDSVFQKKRINISELISPFDRVIKDKTFIDCDIIGPANVGLNATRPGGASVSSCGWFESGGVVTKDTTHVPFGILLQDCTFLRCRIYGLTLFIPGSAYSHIAPNMPGFLWITPEPK
jgi:hypothetical protein